MARGRTTAVMVTRVTAGRRDRMPGRVVAEEPMEVCLDGRPVTTLLRTPGHDYDLAVGWLLTRGLLPPSAPVRQVRYCATGSAVDTGFNIVSVDTGGAAPPEPSETAPDKTAPAATGPVTPESLAGRLIPLTTTPALDPEVAMQVAAESMQSESAAAGVAAPVAAAFDAVTGTTRVSCSDVDAANAVDKVVGRLLLDGALPASAHGLFVSGPVSFLTVAQAWAAGFVAVVGGAAPSDLAVDTARGAGIGLAAVAGEGRLHVYVPRGVGGPPFRGIAQAAP